jgi:hypothetical protein
MQALPNVNVRLANSFRGAVTNERGFFIIKTSEDDTLTFSMVGYYTKSYLAKEVRERLVIYMVQEVKTLAPIVIDGSILIPGLKKNPKDSPWRNPTQDPRVFETPGFQGAQAFGPGFVLRGFISKYSKYEKERKKLVKVKEENKKAKGYVDFVNDPEVKDRLMYELNMS